MKSKISKLLAIGLTVALVASLFAFAVPASARILGWSTETIPGSAGFVVAQEDSVDIAVASDGSTIYAATGGSYLYKSVNRGATWSQIDYDAATSGDDTDLVAVAPDDANIIAVADTANLTVWITTNGGTTFGSLGTPTALSVIRDMDISGESSGVHYLAVAGIDASGDAVVSKYNIGAAAPSWTDISEVAGFTTDTAATNSAAIALAYSPNFPSDQVLAVVTVADDGTDYVYLELYSENSDVWNVSAGFSSYPATVTSDTGLNASTSRGALALDPEYLGSDDSMRLAFVGLDLGGSTTKNGIHRMDDVLAKEIRVGATLDVHSVAYDGATLVAGENDSNTTYYCSDPTVSTPTVSTTRSLKRPGNDTGSTAVVLEWAGSDVVAGVSGKGAFAVSHNDGKSYNDISLVDNLLSDLTDVAVSPDGSKIYLAADDGVDISLWRYASAWERVLTLANSNDFMVRMAPDDGDVVYVVQKSGTSVYYTSDAGEDRWQIRACNVTVEDLAIEGDGTVVYALTSGGRVSKSTNAGFTWSPPGGEATKLTSGNMITSIGEGEVLVGDNGGFVSYSTDSGETWTKIDKQVGDTVAPVVLTATSLADDGYIYAALESASKGIYRWQIGVSEVWTTVSSSATALAYPARGIGMAEGALYVSTANGTDSSVFRALTPFLSPAALITWSTMDSTASFDVGPQGLRISGGSAKLWAINTETTDALYTYTDTLLDTAPAIIGPADDATVPVNPITGYAQDIILTWEKPSDEVLTYDVWIALDSKFDETVKKIQTTSPTPTVSQPVGKDVTGGQFALMPGDLYYWRVRVAGTGPIYSPWSETRSFTIADAEVAPPVTIEPQPTPNITITPPEVVVNVPPMVEVPPSEPVTPGWIYAIVVIGAILIIAVIILIVRTRRAV